MKNQPIESLLQMLSEYADTDTLALHMPGHKRKIEQAEYLKLLAAHLDITEIPGFDDLHDADGILKNSMELAARLWKSERCFYSVNGSTGGILAAIRAATADGDEVLAARNCHKSVYHAIELCRLHPHYLVPAQDKSFGICGSVTPEQVEQALCDFPRARAVIVTSPTYEGVISNIRGICKVAHARGVAVIVDEAHGAHFNVLSGFEHGAVAAGADVVIHSLHKVLPSLTQTAAVHFQGTLVHQNELARQMALFQTSSPSYLLMASIDSCVRWLSEGRETLASSWNNALSAFDEEILSLKKLSVLGHGALWQTKSACFWNLDPGKLVVNTSKTHWSGVELAQRLRQDYQIETEMSQPGYLVAMTSCCDTKEDLLRFARALCELDEQAISAEPKPFFTIPKLPERKVLPQTAQRADIEILPLRQAVNRVSAGYVWAYPPGIPLLVPGEVIEPQIIDALEDLNKSGVHLCGLQGEENNLIQAVENAQAL